MTPASPRLSSTPARPRETVTHTRPSAVVFAGARRAPAHEPLARALGTALAARDLHLVYGGARCGLMGHLADAALEAGGQVTGVITQSLQAMDGVAHWGLDRLEVLPTLAQRTARMLELADAAAALPGGFGTLAELFAALSAAQVRERQIPVGVLEADGYWQQQLVMLDTAHRAGLLDDEDRALLTRAPDPDGLLDALLPQTADVAAGETTPRPMEAV